MVSTSVVFVVLVALSVLALLAGRRRAHLRPEPA
jgi:hypothetical protein